MDKYEYQVCADQIKSLIKERRFTEAMDIADTIDWRRVKSLSMLCTVSEIYKVTKHYSESRDILLLAYERYPDRANVVYALCELAIKLDDISEAVEYYKEYVRLKPHDTNRYVLLYKIYEAQEVPLEEKISLLEEFKKAEFTEKWSYELALLYHKDGQETKCVELCDELALWFGDGPFVRKALELKMQHAALSKEQQRKYDGVYDVPAIPKNEGEETVHIYETQSLAGASQFETTPLETAIAEGSAKRSENTSSVSRQPYGGMTEDSMYANLQVQAPGTDKYSTISLQEELAKNMEEFYAREQEKPAPYYGSTTQLYEPSQAQYMQQINQAGMVPADTAPQAPQMPMDQMYGQPIGTGPIYPDQMGMDSMYGQSMVQQPMDQMYGQPMGTGPIYPNQMGMDPMYGQPMGTGPIYPDQMGIDPMYGQSAAQQMPMDQMYGQPVAQQPQASQIYEQPATPVYEQPVAPVYEQQVQIEAPVEELVQPPVQEPVQNVAKPVVQEPVLNSANITTAQLPVYEEPNSVYAAPVPPKEETASPVAKNTEKPEIKLPDYIKNGTSGVPKDMEDKLKEGLDGQVTMALPDAAEIEKQITGQIELDDFLADWEAKKKQGEEQRKAQLMAKSMEQTTDIMSQLVGVIPGLEEEPVQNIPSESPEVKNDSVIADEEVLRDDDKGVVTKTTISSPNFDRQSTNRSELGSKINGPLKSSITGEIPNILPSADLPIKGDVLPSGHKLTLEEEYGGNIAQIRKDDEELVKRLTGELPPVEEEPVEAVEEPVDYGEAEDIEDVEQPDVVLEDEIQVPDENAPVNTGSIPPLVADKTEEETETDDEDVFANMEIGLSSEEDEETEKASDEVDNSAESIPEEESEEAPVEEEPITYPYEVDDMGEVEELEMIDQPDEVDDMLKTRPIPIEEIEARERYEAGIEDEFTPEEEETQDKRPSHPSYMVLDDGAKSRREFDDAEFEIFGRYEGIEALKAQIVDVMDDMSMDPRYGNVVVIGSELFGRKSLAIDIVRAIQIMDSSFSGKVAKISGEALNKKDIPVTLEKLRDGALIVENAGGLTPVTVNSITEALLASNNPILVVFEGDKESLEPLLNGCNETKTVFNARIIIDDFNDDDLVAYAKGYARELEYSIDEMGTLALHTRIAEMQRIDHIVSIDEVMEIVDAAIRHVDKKNMSHFMDVLLAKRYDDNDYIVLREKDFIY